MKTFKMIFLCAIVLIFVDSQIVAAININGKNDNISEGPVYSLEVPNYFYFKGTDYNLPTIIHERLQISWPRMTFQQAGTNKKIIKNKLNDNDLMIKETNELMTTEVNDPTEAQPRFRPDVSAEQRKITKTRIRIISDEENILKSSGIDVETDQGFVPESSRDMTTSADERDILRHVVGDTLQREIMLKYSGGTTDWENNQEFSDGYLATSTDQRDILKIDGTTNRDNILKTLDEDTETEFKVEFEALSINDRVQIITEHDETTEHGHIVDYSYRDENELESMVKYITTEQTNILESSSGYMTISANKGDILKPLGGDTSGRNIPFKSSGVDSTTNQNSIQDFSSDILKFSTTYRVNVTKSLDSDKPTEHGNELEFLSTEITIDNSNTLKSPSDYTSSSANEKEIMSADVISTTEHALESLDSDLTVQENTMFYSKIQITTEQSTPVSSDGNITGGGTTDQANILKSSGGDITERDNLLKSSNGDIKTEPDIWYGRESLSVHVKNDQKKLLNFVSTPTTPAQRNVLKFSSGITMDQRSVIESTLQPSDGGVTINQNASNYQENILESSSSHMTTSADGGDVVKPLVGDTTTEQGNMLDPSEDIKIEPKDTLGSYSDHIMLVQKYIQDYVRTDITTEIANEHETFQVSEVDVTEQSKLLESSDARSVDGHNNLKASDGDQVNILEQLIDNITTEQRNIFESSSVETGTEKINKNKLGEDTTLPIDEGNGQNFSNSTLEPSSGDELSFIGTQLITSTRGNIFETVGTEITTEQWIMLNSSGEHVATPSVDKRKMLKSSDDTQEILKSLSDDTTEQVNVLDRSHDNTTIKQGNKFRSQSGGVEFFRTHRTTKEEGNIPEFSEIEIMSEHESPGENIATIDDGRDFLNYSNGNQLDGDIQTGQAYILQLHGVRDEQINRFEFPEADVQATQVNLSSSVYGTLNRENETDEIKKQISEQDQVAEQSNKIEFLEPEIIENQVNSLRYSNNDIPKEKINKLKKEERSTDKWNIFNPLHPTNAKIANLKFNMEKDDTINNSSFLLQDTQQVRSLFIKSLEILTKPAVNFTKKVASVNVALFEKTKSHVISNLIADTVHKVFNSNLKLFVKTRQPKPQWEDLFESRKIKTIRKRSQKPDEI